jgi:hypothetical protein
LAAAGEPARPAAAAAAVAAWLPMIAFFPSFSTPALGFMAPLLLSSLIWDACP